MSGGRSPGRVLHAPLEIAGQASRAVRGLRLLGVQADLFALPHPFGYDTPDIAPPDDRIGLARAIAHASRSHDTFHFHFGQSFHPRLRLLDARALRASGRRVVVEFHGSEVRLPSIEAARSPFYVRIEGEDDAGADRLMARWAAITGGHAIACDLGVATFLERHFEHVHHAGLRVEVARYPALAPDADGTRPLVVAHAPSDLKAKGTAFVRAAAERLPGIEYIELRGANNDEVIAGLGRADVIVDQLCLGSYGVVALEAMSVAKPVVCYLAPYRRVATPEGCPIIQADPTTITEVLASWVGRRAELHELGLASRAYAERNHDVAVVARRLLDIYAALPVG